MEIKQSTSARALVFYMVDSTDHVTGKTGLSPTVVISKNGANFASPIGAVQQIGNGFYKVVGHASDSDTLGVLALYATAATADPCAMAYDVVANLESDSITAIAGVASDLAEAYAGTVDAVDTHFSEHGTEWANLDAAVSTRLAAASYTAPNNPTNAAVAGAVRTELAAELGRVDAAISTRASIASTGAQIAAFETA
jgi:hypothetical protein